MRASWILGGACSAALALLMLHCGGGGGSGEGPNGSPEAGAGGHGGGGGGGAGGHGGGAGGGGGSGGGGGGGHASLPDAGGDAWTAPDVGSPVEAGSPGQVDIHFVVHTDQNVAPISPYIYGVNDGSQAAGIHATIVRNGGNRLTAYNWENNASNAGSDYEFENDDYLCSTITCSPNSDTPGAYLKAIVDQATAAGAVSLITVPNVDYVSADKSPPGDVRNSGSNYLSTRFKQNVAAKGAPFSNPPDTTDAYVYQDEMVNWLTTTETSATLWFQLDNEPDLWSSTHAEVHPVRGDLRRARAAQHQVCHRDQGASRRARSSSGR